MKVIVTGGAGFIGSHLVDRLLDDGHDVIVLDNFTTGRPQNLEQHSDSSRLQLIQADVAAHDTIMPYFKGVEWVFHLAALADIVPSVQRPLDYYRANVDGTVSVLHASYLGGARRFVYAASSTCYGIPDVYPTPESAPIRPQYPYALTKYIGEYTALHWCQVYDLPVVSLRFFNVYGPRSRTSGTYGAVFGVFLAQKLAAEPFTVVGDGTQTRDFTYVSDVVNALIAAAESNQKGEVMNVGSGNTYSINRLIELLRGPLTYIPRRPSEPECTYADIGRIRRLLEWQPEVSFEEGVERMLYNIEYYRLAPVWTPEAIAEATHHWFKYLGKDSNV